MTGPLSFSISAEQQALVNVARGGVLDEEALMTALDERRIAGAALDVFREQPLPPTHPLWKHQVRRSTRRRSKSKLALPNPIRF